MRRRAFLLAAAICCGTAMVSTSNAATAPFRLSPYKAEYEVLRNGKPLGRGYVTLQRVDAATWELLNQIRGTEGLAAFAGVDILERSSLQWYQGRLESLDYQYRQQAAWSKRERSVSFDPAAHRIVSRDRDREHVFDFERGALDRQSVVLALAADLADGKRGELTYHVVDRDEAGPQTFRVVGEETVRTPAGALAALRVERVRSDERGRTTTSWHGIEQGFLPVRVLQAEPDGGSFETRLVSLAR
jgi:hypothetical protein